MPEIPPPPVYSSGKQSCDCQAQMRTEGIKGKAGRQGRKQGEEWVGNRETHRGFEGKPERGDEERSLLHLAASRIQIDRIASLQGQQRPGYSHCHLLQPRARDPHSTSGYNNTIRNKGLPLYAYSSRFLVEGLCTSYKCFLVLKPGSHP